MAKCRRATFELVQPQANHADECLPRVLVKLAEAETRAGNPVGASRLSERATVPAEAPPTRPQWSSKVHETAFLRWERGFFVRQSLSSSISSPRCDFIADRPKRREPLLISKRLTMRDASLSCLQNQTSKNCLQHIRAFDYVARIGPAQYLSSHVTSDWLCIVGTR